MLADPARGLLVPAREGVFVAKTQPLPRPRGVGAPRPDERETLDLPCCLRRRNVLSLRSKSSAQRSALSASRSQFSAEATKILPGGDASQSGVAELEVFAFVP